MEPGGGILSLSTTVTGTRSGGGQASFTVQNTGTAGMGVVVDSRSNSMNFWDGVATHYNPWINYFIVPTTPPYVWHTSSYDNYTFNLKVSAPTGTPAGIYTINGSNNFYFGLLYCSSTCSFSQASVRQSFAITGSASFTVLGSCTFSGSALTLDYGTLRPKDVNGSQKSASTQLTCNSDVSAGTLTLTSTSGSNQTSAAGTSVKVGNDLDAIVTVNGQDASAGINITGPVSQTITVASQLETYGKPAIPGAFSGSAVLTFAPY